MIAMFTTPFALVSMFQCLCFCVSLVAISFALRGWNDKRNLAVVFNLLGLWSGLVALDFLDVKTTGFMQVLLIQSYYLMRRRAGSGMTRQELSIHQQEAESHSPVLN